MKSRTKIGSTAALLLHNLTMANRSNIVVKKKSEHTVYNRHISIKESRYKRR